MPQDPDTINTSPNYADTFLNTSGNMQQFVNSAAVQPNNSYYSIDIQGMHLISLSNYVSESFGCVSVLFLRAPLY